MKAHDYTLCDTWVKQKYGVSTTTESLLRLSTDMPHKPNRLPPETAQASAELAWERCGKPYYIVYPVIQESLAKAALDIPAELIRLPRPAILIRFCVGHEPNGIRCILASNVKTQEGAGLTVWVDLGETLDTPTSEIPIMDFRTMPILSGKTFEECSSMVPAAGHAPDTHTLFALHFIAGLCLLGEDSEIVSPDVLASDRLHYEDTQDPSLVARAHRRGKIGFLIGADIEVAPHLRRPHFAVRWTGPGSKVPRLTPVKGSIVHRSKLTTVPQGFES